MTEILVDSNVILDVLTEDTQWFEWSAQILTDYTNQGDLVINSCAKRGLSQSLILNWMREASYFNRE